MKYLEFEKPIEELEKQLQDCRALEQKNGVSGTDLYKKLSHKLALTKKAIYENLTPWQYVDLSRHPERPYALDYINFLAGDTFFPLYGDRNIGDDKSIVGGLGKIGDQSFMFIGQQKGRTTAQRTMRNFGMPNPEGYRKALRLMRMAEKFRIPVVTFVDTPGAYPGIRAEKRGQAEAIARNIYEMLKLETPLINIIIGEGASGGALGICVGDRVFMMEYSWYSVISPESCSTILWKSVAHKKDAAEKLKLTSKDMFKMGLIDAIVSEPLGGAHKDPEQTFNTVKNTIVEQFKILQQKPPSQLTQERLDKYARMRA